MRRYGDLGQTGHRHLRDMRYVPNDEAWWRSVNMRSYWAGPADARRGPLTGYLALHRCQVGEPIPVVADTAGSKPGEGIYVSGEQPLIGIPDMGVLRYPTSEEKVSLST